MRILLVDNGTSYKQQLLELLKGHAVDVVAYNQIDVPAANAYDAVVLSGGHSFPVSGNDDRLQKELELVRNSTKPIFGICFGFEVVAYALGASLESLAVPEKGVVDIEVLVPDELFLGISTFQVFESHRYVVTVPPEGCIALARSKDGIEALKHETRPIFAVQFHPEMFVDTTCGSEIFKNFVALIERLA